MVVASKARPKRCDVVTTVLGRVRYTWVLVLTKTTESTVHMMIVEATLLYFVLGTGRQEVVPSDY